MTATHPSLWLDGVSRVFGYPDTPAKLQVVPRSTRWRAVHAARSGGAGYALMLLTPLPPHLGWLLGGFGAGTFLALRRWSERFTLTSMEAACPRCDTPLVLPSPTRLRAEMTLGCPACGHEVTLVVPIPESA